MHSDDCHEDTKYTKSFLISYFVPFVFFVAISWQAVASVSRSPACSFCDT